MVRELQIIVDYSQREFEIYNKAKKYKPFEYNSPVFDRNGEYFSSLDEYFDSISDTERKDTWVWCAKKIELKLDVEDMIYSALENHYEDAKDNIDESARKELQYLVDSWTAKKELQSIVDSWAVRQKIVSYEVDKNFCVIIEAEDQYQN